MGSFTHRSTAAAEYYKQLYETLLSKFQDLEKANQMLQEECSSLKTSFEEKIAHQDLILYSMDEVIIRRKIVLKRPLFNPHK